MNKLDINLTPTAALLEIGSKAKVSCRTWGIPAESNSAFLLIHGLGGHSGWFEALARRLKVKHVFVMALDLSGFGKRINDSYTGIGQWIEDIECVYAYLHSIMGKKPIFLLGNSMGALLALKACMHVKPSGLILLSPAFGGHPRLFPLLYQLSSLLKAVFMPNKEITLPYGTDLITKEEQVKFWLDSSGNARKAVPGKMLLDLLFLTKNLRLSQIRLPCPLFMITAGMDAIVSNQASELIFRQIKAPAKKKTLMSSSAHDLALDLMIDQLTNMLFDWSLDPMQKVENSKSISKSKTVGK